MFAAVCGRVRAPAPIAPLGTGPNGGGCRAFLRCAGRHGVLRHAVGEVDQEGGAVHGGVTTATRAHHGCGRFTPYPVFERIGRVRGGRAGRRRPARSAPAPRRRRRCCGHGVPRPGLECCRFGCACDAQRDPKRVGQRMGTTPLVGVQRALSLVLASCSWPGPGGAHRVPPRHPRSPVRRRLHGRRRRAAGCGWPPEVATLNQVGSSLVVMSVGGRLSIRARSASHTCRPGVRTNPR